MDTVFSSWSGGDGHIWQAGTALVFAGWAVTNVDDKIYDSIYYISMNSKLA